MPFIVLLVVLILLAAIVLMFVREAQQRSGSSSGTSTLPLPDPPPARRSTGGPQHATAEETLPVNTDELADHVRELRRAVDDGLLPRQEAVDSIVRQAGGGIGDEAAERLLESAAVSEDDDAGEPGDASG